jgi:hypothetical protein
MDYFTFHVENKNGIYLMKGNTVATGKSSDKIWQDHIHYYVYKLSDEGITQGVWSSAECKGFYLGEIIK